MSHCYARAWRTRRDHKGLGPRNNRVRGGERKQLACSARAQTRRFTGITTTSEQWRQNDCLYIFMQIKELQPASRRVIGSEANTQTHTQNRTRSRVSLTKPAQNNYGEKKGEELGSSPAALRPPQNTIYFQYLSLSFIAQGGRPLPPVTSCLFTSACYLGFHLSRLVPI